MIEITVTYQVPGGKWDEITFTAERRQRPQEICQELDERLGFDTYVLGKIIQGPAKVKPGSIQDQFNAIFKGPTHG